MRLHGGWKMRNIGRLLVHYAIPAVIGTMVNALYNIVDRIFIGQGVGALAISGLTLTFPILLFMQAFGMLIGAGAATRVSIHLGRKANDLADNVLGNAFTLTFIIGALTIIPSMIFLDDLLTWFGGSEQTIPYAKDYLYIAIPGNLLATLSFSFNARDACFRISEKGDVHDDDRCRIERDPRPDLYLLAGYGDTGCRYRYGDLHGRRCRFRDESFYQQG